MKSICVENHGQLNALSADDEDKPLIQGWALVDNTTEDDWEGVSLSLVAGLPISFIHDLYTPRYRQRPVIRVEEEAAVAPPVVESGMMMDEMALGEEPGWRGAVAPLTAPSTTVEQRMPSIPRAAGCSRQAMTDSFVVGSCRMV